MCPQQPVPDPQVISTYVLTIAGALTASSRVFIAASLGCLTCLSLCDLLMESNKDEALKCLTIAQNRRNTGDLAAARRFCQKSLALFSTSEAERLLELIESEAASDSAQASSSGSSSAGASASASAAETHPSSSGARQRHTASTSGGGEKANGNATGAQKKRDYTPEQAAVVKRVRSCKVTEYYEILSVKKDCEEAEIKKAYRKVR